jgi:GxxExxY protein
LNHRGTEDTEVNGPQGLPRDPLTERIVGLAIEVHKALGSGLLESAYEECLCYELSASGLTFRRQVPLPIQYKSVQLDCAYRADIIVDSKVLLELKAIERLMPVHRAQLLSYLRLSGLKTGLLLNFHVPLLRDGLVRMVL